MKVKISKSELMDLMDEINDECLDLPSLKENPKLGDLVCAQLNSSGRWKGRWQRGVVVKIIENSFHVRFVDFGVTLPFPKEKLKTLEDPMLLNVSYFNYFHLRT